MARDACGVVAAANKDGWSWPDGSACGRIRLYRNLYATRNRSDTWWKRRLFRRSAARKKDAMKRYGMVVAAVFPLTVLAAWAEPQHHFCRYIVWPGAAIAIALPMDIWRHSLVALCLAIAFNALLYSAMLWLSLKFLGFVLSRKSRRNA
jgi:hypothetical protein